MASSREEIKRRFRELEQYIGDIVRHDAVKDDKKDECLEPADGIVELKFPGTVGGAAERPLITPIVVDAAPVGNEQQSVDSRKLRMALQLPLVALGSVSIDKASSVDGAESAWWLDTARSSDNKQTVSLIASRFVGPWFRATILGTAAEHILDDPELMEVAQKYLSDRTVGKTVVFAIAAVFGSTLSQRNECSIESLTLATKLLAHAVATGLLSPQAALEQTSINNISPRSPADWTFLLQIMCTLPERVANRVDPQSIPPPLLARQYFARLAREAVALLGNTRRMADRFVVDLLTKLCRVGQSHFVSIELAAAALVAVSSEPDRLMSLVQTMCLVPVPFREALVYGTVSQLERIARDAAGAEFRIKLTAVLGALLYCQIDPSGLALPAEQAVAGMLVRGSQTFLTETAPTPVVLQALVLAMQQLVSGNLPEMPGMRVPLLPKYDRTFPDLMHTALQRTIIPMWSSLSFAVRPTTMLVLLCVGGMAQKDEEERQRLAMTSEFANAIPRFLDAPTPRVRLSGIVVADCVIGGEDVDFGLDDILRDAQRPGAPNTVVASAKYIQELRSYARPISEQWTDTHCKPLDKAIDHARAYTGEEEEEEETSKVLAPRQSSLHAGSEALQSGFVKPRTPAFLRDCLAYLKPPAGASDDSNGNNTEKVRIGLFALTKCIEAANTKTVEEVWLQTANRVLYTYNRGPDHLDAEWDAERRGALVALAVRLPKLVGPFLADRSCDRNVTLRDRELVLSAIATACIQMTDFKDVESATKQLEQTHIGATLGTVVRRSRRLDIVPKQRTKQASADIEPSFFFPLVAQFGRSDMSSASSDIRRNAAFLERYLSTLGVILYMCGSSAHQIAMAREFWALCRLVRALQDRGVSEAPPVLDALLFGIDVILSPERSLSIPTLGREFRLDIADVLQWIGRLLEEREALLVPSAVAHASRILTRLREIQEKVYADYTSII